MASTSERDIDLLAKIAMAEAESQTELGKRLVIDTVLNRVDSDEFPDTVEKVIFQKGQFAPIIDGRWEQCYVKDDIRELVIEELENRTNSDVMFFRTKRYSKYGTPLFKEDDHYFSSN